MRGYKGMDANMRCRGMQYEVGKTYYVDGEIKLCRNGLHFCKSLVDVFYFYDCDGGNRFFEVEATEPVYSDGVKYVSSQLTVIRELSGAEVNRARYGNGNGDGSGNGAGDGYGYGYGVGGDGYGYGYGAGGDGYGDGYGAGGYGYGYGDEGDGGDGYGYDHKDIQKVLVFK